MHSAWHWILARIREPSTWAGISAAALASGYTLPAFIFAAIAVIVRDPGSQPSE